MPASMMSAPVGSTLKVSGSSMAMVAIGPTPGSTPISVPTRHPRKHNARLLGDSAVANPSPRLPIRSNMGASIADQPRRQRNRQPEREFEHPDADRPHHPPKHDRRAPAPLVAGKSRDDDGDRSRHDQAERAHRQAEGDDRTEHEYGSANGPALEARAAFKPGVENEQRPEQAEQYGKTFRQHARTHAAERSERQLGAGPEGKDRDGDDDQAAEKILPPQQRRRRRIEIVGARHVPSCPARQRNLMPGHAPAPAWPCRRHSRRWPQLRGHLVYPHRASRPRRCGHENAAVTTKASSRAFSSHPTTNADTFRS